MHVVLISSGIEFILFLVASSVLCFGFSMIIMLTTHSCGGLPLKSVRPRVHRE